MIQAVFNMKPLQVSILDTREPEKAIQVVEVLHGSFAHSNRYTVSRLTEEIKPQAQPLYRQFFVATINAKGDNQVVGAGGVKAADWASNTHILYLSAVHPDYRNQGVGKRLVKARIEWIRSTFGSGRLLVSTAKLERFKQFGFKAVSKPCDSGRAIMIMEFY